MTDTFMATTAGCFTTSIVVFIRKSQLSLTIGTILMSLQPTDVFFHLLAYQTVLGSASKRLGAIAMIHRLMLNLTLR